MKFHSAYPADTHTTNLVKDSRNFALSVKVILRILQIHTLQIWSKIHIILHCLWKCTISFHLLSLCIEFHSTYYHYAYSFFTHIWWRHPFESEYLSWNYFLQQLLKGLSHEILGPVYWSVWMHLGLNKNRFWFLNFEEAPSKWGSHFKFWCVSVQTFSEILRISEKDWQLRTQLPMLLRELGTQLPILLRELVTPLPIILGDSTTLQEIFTP
jgi:hypothetical protein